LVPCPNLVLPSLEPPAHTFRALERCWHAGEGLPYCPVTSRGSSGAANDRAGEGYQVRARYQIRANALLPLSSVLVRLGPVLDGPALCVSALRGVPLLFVVCVWGGGGREINYSHTSSSSCNVRVVVHLVVVVEVEVEG